MSDAIPVNRIKGVGEKTAALFGKINVYTVDDLIRHYPRDYETYGAPVSIREASPGSVQASLRSDHRHPQCEESPQSLHPQRHFEG